MDKEIKKEFLDVYKKILSIEEREGRLLTLVEQLLDECKTIKQEVVLLESKVD